MNDDLRINKINKLKQRKAPLKPDRDNLNKEEERREHEHREEVGSHYQDLVKAAEDAHTVLAEKNSPYRFYIYKLGEEVFIDVVIVGDDGEIKETKKRNITHNEFMTWLNRIEEGDGLFCDINA